MVMRLAGLVAAGVALASCAKGSPASSPTMATGAAAQDAQVAPAGVGQGLTCTGSNGLSFVFSFGSPKVGELFAVDVEVRRSSGPLPDGLTLRADATMPEHGHGMMTKPETKPAAAAPASPAPAGGSHRVQIGIFSIEANAKRAADTLKKASIAATVKQGQTQGKNHWSVTASGSGDKAALLAKIKGLGFADAYALK